MLKNIFFGLLVFSFMWSCTVNDEPTAIMHFSIAGNYSGDWQECITQNMKTDCSLFKNGNARIIIFNQNSIIFQAMDMKLKDTLVLKPNSPTSQNSYFTFEKSNGNTSSQIIFNSLDNSIAFCNQIFNDSLTIENCFKGIKN